MNLVGKKNRYTCMSCGYQFVTIDKDEGTTPFMTLCRRPDRCTDMAQSEFYRVDQALVPTHEWYKPTQLEIRDIIDPGILQHIAMGGLLLRRIGA